QSASARISACSQNALRPGAGAWPLFGWLRSLVALVVLHGNLVVVHAQNYVINLDGAQDGGGGRTGSGSGTLTLVGTALTFNNILYSGLSANVTLAHIH